MYFNIIFSRGLNGEFGYKNTLPWHISDDLKHFRQITENSTIIMGYNTYKTLTGILPNRKHIRLRRGLHDEHSQHRDGKALIRPASRSRVSRHL